MDDGAERVLSERLAAEQDERRRLAELIHDGPVQSLAALSQMLDAAAHALSEGDTDAAERILTRSLTVTREASADLRELVEGIEPRSLEEAGFAGAVTDLLDRVAGRRSIEARADLAGADRLGEQAGIGLYQIVREAVDQAVRRGPPTRVEVAVTATEHGGVVLEVRDDGAAERRSAVIQGLAERAESLGAELEAERTPEATVIRVTVPPVAAAR